MPFEERNTLAALFVNVLTSLYMILKLRSLHAAGAFAGDDALVVFGKTVLWVIPIAIVATIALTILFNILIAILTRDPKPSFVTDERDQIFKTRAMMTTLVVTGIGFICAMIALAAGWTALATFTLIYFAFAAGDFTGNLVKMASYRV